MARAGERNGIHGELPPTPEQVLHSWDVVIELLVVADCPNEGPALAVLRVAAALAGVDARPVTVRVIDSAEEARRRGFVGSPTFLIDGVDPFAVPAEPTGVTCRVYATARGLAGVPEVESLRDALLRV